MTRMAPVQFAWSTVVFCLVALATEARAQFGPTRAQVDDVPAITPTDDEVVREAERIREELGGSAVERFEHLRAEGPNRRPGGPNFDRGRGGQRGRGSRPDDSAPRRVAALRRAAQELDLAANRVEEVEAYAEADAIRATANLLRANARRIAGGEMGGPSPSTVPSGPAPAPYSATWPTPAFTPTPSPSLQPAPGPSPEPGDGS